MTPQDNLHSRLVGWAKIILPLCALALLSTLFLFARGTGTPDEIALARISEIAREQRLASPEFAGVTADGSVLVIAAKSAKPDPARPDTVSISEIALRLDAPGGNRIEILAVEGEVDGRALIARFLGLARVETSNGYMLETNDLVADLSTGVITSDGVLEVRAPFGEITAGRIRFDAATGDIGQRLLFTNGVRLLYTGNAP